MSDTDDPLQADLARLAGQEERLQLPALNTDVAWTIGMQLRAMALARMSARFELPRSTAKGAPVGALDEQTFGHRNVLAHRQCRQYP